ncbi:hypothetical protein L6R52_39410, partial [Myxococcota bacterium]|nr:hypothetical protein [Myxococcota bacterium]
MPVRRIIRGATVVALDGRRMLRKTDLLIEDGVIAAIGGVDSAGALITEVSGVVMPGLVQAHVHLDETLLDQTFVPDLDPIVLAERQLPAWRRALDEAASDVLVQSGLARGLGTGT